MAVNVGSAVAYLEMDTSKFSKGLSSATSDLKVFLDKNATAEQKLKGLSSSMATVGSGLTKSVTLPIVGIGTASIGAASNFETAMSQVAATMGTTKDQIIDLENTAKTLGATTSFSATEAAEGLNILAMSGLDANEQMAALPTVLDLAAAGALSLDSAASYVTGTVKGFSDSMDNAQYYSDLMAKGATLANTDVSALGEALSTASSTSASYGQTAEGTTLSLLRLAEQNVTGAEAATALNRAMMDLYTPTTSAKKALDSLGVSAYDSEGKAKDFNILINELNDSLSGMSEEEANATKNAIFSTYGLQAFNKMLVSSDETVTKFKDGLADAGGSSAQQAQTQLDNLEGSVTLLKSALEGAGISIGERLSPYIRKLADFISELLTRFNELTDEQKDQIVKWGLIVAAIGPVLLIGSKIITMVANVISVIKVLKTVMTAAFASPLAPIVLVVAAIAGLVIAIKTLYENNEEFRNKVNGIWESIQQTIGTAVNKIVEFFTVKIPEAFNNAKEKIGDFVQSVIDFFVVTLPEAFRTFVNETIPNAINSIVQWFDELPYKIGYAIGEMIAYIYLFGTKIWNWITTKLPQIIEGIVQWFAELPSKIWDWLVNAVENIIEWGEQVKEKGTEIAENFINNVIKWFSELPSKVSSWLSSTITKIKQWAVDMKQKAVETGKNFLNSLIDNIKSIPSKVQTILKNALTSITNLKSNFKQAGKDIFNALLDGLKSVGNKIKDYVQGIADTVSKIVSGIIDGFKKVISKASEAKEASSSVNGSHANGLSYVPFDGYIAELHEGERVLTKQENQSYSGGSGSSGSGDTFIFYNTEPDPYTYARQMKKAKRELLGGLA
jgi:TP901 family phage tail tape measure protein